MKKPTAVKIVEVLGWMEVVLVLYGVIWAVNAIVHGKCGSASDVWICMGISLVVLALPVGMVMSLRHGRRAGFIWPHSGVALFAVFALSMVLEMWCAAAIALILLVAVLFLLFRPEATHWFNEMSNGKMLDDYGCAAIFLTGLMYLLAAPAFVGMLSELLTDGPKRMQVLKPKNIHAISLSEESLSELADTYVLTPTGRVAIVDKAASLEKSANQDISREVHQVRKGK